MRDLYWITRFGALNDIAIAMIIASSVVLAFSIVISAAVYKEYEDNEAFRMLLRYARISIVALSVSSVVYIFVPSTKQALFIYGIGGTIDYVKNDDKGKQLPGKVIDALDRYMDSLNNREEKK